MKDAGLSDALRFSPIYEVQLGRGSILVPAQTKGGPVPAPTIIR